MADTRCANPEYQLDVDIMMVDYMVYHSIDANLKAVKAELSIDSHDRQGVKDAAKRLVASFDTLIRLFHHNHPTAVLTESTTFNIKILELLVLFGQWMHREPCSRHLSHERSLNARYRQQWLHAWATDEKGLGGDMKSYIISNSDSDIITQNDRVDLTDVLTRFMGLSAEAAFAAGSVNEHWYTLAADFMVQCAVERSDFLINHDLLHDTRHVPTIATWLSECFAWGVTNPCPLAEPQHSISLDTFENASLDQRLQDQVFIRDMFRLHNDGSGREDKDGDTLMNTDDHNEGSQALIEDPRWTSLRTKHHAEVLEIIEACSRGPSDPTSCTSILEQLQHRYPISKFLLRFLNFVDGLWCLNMEDLGGKPVLVQIEEGGLAGLSEEEFRGFLDRVGLKVKGSGDEHGKGVVRWAR